MGCIRIEDLAANAMIEISKSQTDYATIVCCVSLKELEAYGKQVVRYLHEHGNDAVIILSRDDTSRMLAEYSEFFKKSETHGDTAIALKEGKTISDLVEKFRTYLALDLMMAFMNTDMVCASHKVNG